MTRSEDILLNAETRLKTFGRFSGLPDLGGISTLLDALGNPQKKLKFVHVGGTNGKGSTTSMIAAGLKSGGYRVGMYTSPSVEKLTERVCIDMEQVDDEVFASALNRVMDAAEASGLAPAQFDVLTAAAFLVFAEAECDIVAAEVGLGGRLDATNIIDVPEVAVITSVSADHVEQLGSDLGLIAREKCGIFKDGGRAVCFPCQDEAVFSVVVSEAEKKNCALRVPDVSEIEIKELTSLKTEFSYRGTDYTLTMPGRHFVFNAVTAIEAMKVLAERGWKLSVKDMVSGVAVAPLTGRLQTVFSDPDVIVDGAHNPDAAEKLCAAVGELFPGKRIITVMGMYSDKDWQACVEKIAAISDVFIATEPTGQRTQSAEAIANAAIGRAGLTCISRRPAQAMIQALSFWRRGDAVICCGSFALAADVKKTLAKFGPYIAEFIK
ncbi:MAG: bifunctional folylpolyglutamate synthase/dihydrofolate synthase [Clostridia bacterium]|nr:bifunctional folylpolyglutamate synthase/dihydrofolate synthase [Clostridia bacterium]